MDKRLYETLETIKIYCTESMILCRIIKMDMEDDGIINMQELANLITYMRKIVIHRDILKVSFNANYTQAKNIQKEKETTKDV